VFSVQCLVFSVLVFGFRVEDIEGEGLVERGLHRTAPEGEPSLLLCLSVSLSLTHTHTDSHAHALSLPPPPLLLKHTHLEGEGGLVEGGLHRTLAKCLEVAALHRLRAVRLSRRESGLQGYLPYKQTHPPRTLP